MKIPLPNLDDRTYTDLVEEARTLLPSLVAGERWTDHNPSDPGITLVELFAWLTEMLVWRTNRVADANVRAFLTLLNGPGWQPTADPAADVRQTVLALRDAWRAVTPADYERLSLDDFNGWLADARAEEAAGGSLLEWTRVTGLDPLAGGLPSTVPPLARARAVPRRDLGAGTEAERTADRPAVVSVLVVPRRDGPPPPPLSDQAPPGTGAAVRQALGGFLDERRLLATQVRVVAPVYVPVRVQAVLVRRADLPDPVPPQALADRWPQVPDTDVRKAALTALAGWLDPLRGGPAADGWPFGRDVHVSDLYAVLEAVPGVDHVADVRVFSTCPQDEAGCVAAPELWHDATGEQLGLALAAHHLPRARLATADVHVGAAMLRVRVAASLHLSPGTPYQAGLRAALAAARRVFHPATGGPGGSQEKDVRAIDVRAELRRIPEVDATRAVQVTLDTDDPARLVERDDQERQAVHFEPREVAAVEVELFVDGKPLW